MKSKANEISKEEEPNESFIGLVKDIDNEIALFTKEHIVYLGLGEVKGHFDVYSKADFFCLFSPFTKFNGTVTLEND